MLAFVISLIYRTGICHPQFIVILHLYTPMGSVPMVKIPHLVGLHVADFTTPPF